MVGAMCYNKKNIHPQYNEMIVVWAKLKAEIWVGALVNYLCSCEEGQLLRIK